MTHRVPSPANLLFIVFASGFVACGADSGSPQSDGSAGASPITGTAGLGGAGAGAGGLSAGAGGAGTAAGTAGVNPGIAGMQGVAGSAGAVGSAGSAGSAGNGGSAGDDATAGTSGQNGTPDSGTPDSGSEDDDPIIGEGGVLDETIIVQAGETFDGDNLRYRAGPALGDGSQSEDQQPLFRLEDGARLINVVIGAPAADGIHTYGDVTLENIVWEDIGEDALTIKESGTVVLDGGSAANGDDKVFQINAASTFRVSNFSASNAGKFIRQNGGTTFKVDVFIDRCDISDMDEAIFRTDSSVSTVNMSNTRYHNIGDALFIGVNSANITQSNNTEY